MPLRPDELRSLLDELGRLTEAAGRDPRALTISYKAPIYDTAAGAAVLPDGSRRPFSGEPGQVAEDIQTYTALGVSELIVDFRRESLSDTLERMERFATTLGPAAGA